MEDTKYISVSELTDILKMTIEKVFNRVCLRGEISGYRPSSSGHCYFTLKDDEATISAVIFRYKLPQVTAAFHNAGIDKIENGQEVFIEGSLSLYKKGGSYSVVIEKMVPAGIGSVYQRFEMLKKKLEAEGLFDSSRKKPIPKHPECIGVVTSPTGAALQDVLNVLKRRSPQTRVIVFPTAVQGDEAKSQIAKAIGYADSQYRTKGKHAVDVLLVVRGGGSMEDLWAFNEEEVAYSIADCQVPVVSGVGHEIDFTITDFCADLRAPTPSAAAEIVSCSNSELIEQVGALSTRLENIMRNQISFAKNRCSAYDCDFLFQRMRRICNDCAQFSYTEERIEMLFRNILENRRSRIQLFSEKIASMNPQQILNRGYAMVYDESSNVISDSSKVNAGDKVFIKVKSGEIKATVS